MIPEIQKEIQEIKVFLQAQGRLIEELQSDLSELRHQLQVERAPNCSDSKLNRIECGSPVASRY